MSSELTHILIWTRRIVTLVLIGIAFWFSYSHTTAWFRSQGQNEGADVLALLPELGLALVILTLLTVDLDFWTQAVLSLIGATSLGITITGNLSQAGDGLSGQVAALAAPFFSSAFFVLEVRGLVSEHTTAGAESSPAAQEGSSSAQATVQVQNVINVAQMAPAGVVQKSEPVPEPVHVTVLDPEPTSEPVVQNLGPDPVHIERSGPAPRRVQNFGSDRRPAQITSGRRPSPERLMAQNWAEAQTSWPTSAQIVAQFPSLSVSTAKRIKPTWTGGTGTEGEAGNHG